MNFLLKCGDEVRMWVGRRLRGQCEQHWGPLCSSFSGICSLSQSDAPQYTAAPPPTAPWPITAQGPLQQPSRAEKPENRSALSNIDNVTESSLLVSEKSNVTASWTDRRETKRCRQGTQTYKDHALITIIVVVVEWEKNNYSGRKIIKVLSVVLLTEAMQHNLFNLLGISAILIFFLNLTLYKDENQLSTSLQHHSYPVSVSFSKGHGHTRVNTLFIAQVQLMAQSQYSTYLNLFLYLWGLLFYAPGGGLQSARREALFGYDVL